MRAGPLWEGERKGRKEERGREGGREGEREGEKRAFIHECGQTRDPVTH